MYINKIDDLIDKVIDDFYSTVILSDNRISKIMNEINFVKYQSDINDIFKKYIDSVNLIDIKKNVSNNDILNKIIGVIKKYITIYMFLFIGYYFKTNNTIYTNNIIEFSKNQSEYGYKIDEFFNSESNALIVELYTKIKQILSILDSESKQRKETLEMRPDYKETINFLNYLGKDFIEEFFNIKDKNFIRAHNIIKTIIIIKVYKEIEKKDLFRILDLLENTDTEFTFIDIVVPIKEIIDISTIENLLSKKEIASGMAKVIWEYIYETEISDTKLEKTIDEKIDILLNSNLFVPIVDDILLYHNNNELYEKKTEYEKKREDTKIRYIIDKIDMATNLNIDSNHKEAKKIFYQPMFNRKVVLINNYEDTKIINKFINVSKLSTENSEYLKDLEHIVIYPYINLRDSKNGVYLQPSKTIDTLRYINFEDSKEYKQKPNSNIEVRVGTKDNFINVVGFMFRPLDTIYCIKNKELKSIKNGKDKNGYKMCMEILEEIINKKDKNDMNLYWLFNPDDDKIEIDTYEQQNKLTRPEQIKHILGIIYDNLEKIIYNKIIKDIKNLKNAYIDNISIISSYYENIMKIEKNDILIELENTIYDKLIKKGEIKYDKYDDIVYGLSKDSIELPSYDKDNNNNKNILRINLSEIKKLEEEEEKEKVDGVCQHNITWDRLGLLKKENPKMFLDELYIFVQNYVIDNVDHEYVCKSCGFFLNIKKYVADGSFDDDHHFITYSMPLDTPLEDIPGYEKYRGSIRNIDKYIEKIALITNIPYFIGKNPTIKSRRKLIVRDAIDLIISNNLILKKIQKERNIMATKLYGINRNYSNLFTFELENSIFIFSSKDKDYYKPIKQNNIIGYIIFLMLLEINESQIFYFNNDKKGYCNFEVFNKVYHTIFEGLKFRKNNKGDTIPVKNYEIFCYILYIISCYSIKYNLWYYDYKDSATDKSKRMKLIPIIQKIIIHTVVDIINSCLENSEENGKKNKIFEILKTKFYKKLNQTFSNKELYNRLKEQNTPSTIGDKKAFILTNIEAVKLDGKYLTEFDTVTFWEKIKPYKKIWDIKYREIEKYDTINNITNCEKGTFHNWIYDNKTFKCTICGETTKDIKYDKIKSKKIIDNYHNVELISLSKKYCYIDGNFHEYQTDKQGNKICIKCKTKENYEFKDNELEQLDKKLIENKKKNIENILEFNKKNNEYIKNKEDYLIKLKEKITTEYKNNITTDNKYKYIDNLIDIFEENISEEIIKKNISLKYNTYVFDHDYLGNKLDKKIYISDKENKIQFKSMHTFFNKDVIYYTTYKVGKIEVFYDTITKNLLGYKEENKNYVLNTRQNKKLYILYSIKNKLMLLGHKYQYYNLIDIDNDNDNNKEKNNKNKIVDIIRNRHDILNNTIYRYQRLIYRLVNNYQLKNNINEKTFINEEENYFTNKYDNLIEKYNKKIKEINLTSQTGNHLILKHWKNLINSLIIEVDNNIEINSNTINYDKINKIDYNGNLILFYFINEIIKMYKYNDNKILKINLTLLIIDYININFEMFNEEKIQNDKDYKRFWYVINSQTYINEIKDKVGETEGIYEEAIDMDKKELTQEEIDSIDDANEEDNALDVENNEIDYEAGYERNLERGINEELYEKIQENTLMDYINMIKI